MMRIVAFATGTAAVLAVAIGWQAFGASNGEENKDQPQPAVSTQIPSTDPTEPADGSATTAPDGTTEGPAAGTTDKIDEGERDGFTEDHAGKPGETKDR